MFWPGLSHYLLGAYLAWALSGFYWGDAISGRKACYFEVLCLWIIHSYLDVHVGGGPRSLCLPSNPFMFMPLFLWLLSSLNDFSLQSKQLPFVRCTSGKFELPKKNLIPENVRFSFMSTLSRLLSTVPTWPSWIWAWLNWYHVCLAYTRAWVSSPAPYDHRCFGAWFSIPTLGVLGQKNQKFKVTPQLQPVSSLADPCIGHQVLTILPSGLQLCSHNSTTGQVVSGVRNYREMEKNLPSSKWPLWWVHSCLPLS